MTIAPGPAKLIRKGKLGISVWVEILLHKYAFGIPFARQLQDFRLRGLTLSPGTVAGGLKIIQPLFEPVAEAIRERVASDEQWHADETRWLVCGDEKEAKKHWLWVFLSSTAAYYSVDDNRSASVCYATVTVYLSATVTAPTNAWLVKIRMCFLPFAGVMFAETLSMRNGELTD